MKMIRNEVLRQCKIIDHFTNVLLCAWSSSKCWCGFFLYANLLTYQATIRHEYSIQTQHTGPTLKKSCCSLGKSQAGVTASALFVAYDTGRASDHTFQHGSCGWMDGYGWMNEWMGGWVDEWMDGGGRWIDGWMTNKWWNGIIVKWTIY